MKIQSAFEKKRNKIKVTWILVGVLGVFVSDELEPKLSGSLKIK